VALGGEGVGLLRSEFLFLNRASAPSEQEQYEVYVAIARTLGRERPLVVRALDVGGDKPLPYLPLPREENPFLGVRGLRLLLERPEVLRTQLRAILRASAEGRVSVMLPMVATLAEFRAAKAVFEEERRRLGAAPVPLGIMIEVPAAALLADAFAREADFFSIGTNDLTQYVLAMDRGHPKLASLVDGLEPAVLMLIARAARAGQAHGRWVGVCGGLAGDSQAVPILLGLGVSELSVSVPTIPTIKARVRGLDLGECRTLAERALAAGSAAEVRALLPDPLADEDGA
jgi:phosphocarrier protein FPr